MVYDVYCVEMYCFTQNKLQLSNMLIKCVYDGEATCFRIKGRSFVMNIVIVIVCVACTILFYSFV